MALFLKETNCPPGNKLTTFDPFHSGRISYYFLTGLDIYFRCGFVWPTQRALASNTVQVVVNILLGRLLVLKSRVLFFPGNSPLIIVFIVIVTVILSTLYCPVHSEVK